LDGADAHQHALRQFRRGLAASAMSSSVAAPSLARTPRSIGGSTYTTIQILAKSM